MGVLVPSEVIEKLGVRSCNITLLPRAGADGVGRLKYSSIRGRMIVPP